MKSTHFGNGSRADVFVTKWFGETVDLVASNAIHIDHRNIWAIKCERLNQAYFFLFTCHLVIGSWEIWLFWMKIAYTIPFSQTKHDHNYALQLKHAFTALLWCFPPIESKYSPTKIKSEKCLEGLHNRNPPLYSSLCDTIGH